MVVDDQGSKSIITRSENSDVEFHILNRYNKNSNSASGDAASPSSSTNPIVKDDPPSSDSSLQQGDLETDQTIDILVREFSKRIQKNHSISDIIEDFKAGVQTRGNSEVNYREMIRHICSTSKNIAQECLLVDCCAGKVGVIHKVGKSMNKGEKKWVMFSDNWP